MDTKSLRFKIIDGLYIAMMIIPILIGIVIQVLTEPASSGINITGARVFFTIPMPIQDLPVSEAQINSVIVIIVITAVCLFMTHGLGKKTMLKRHYFAEVIVEKIDGMVNENMGEFFKAFSPFIIAILALSGLSSLMSLLGLFPPTSDINIVAGWAILIFILITYYKLKGGFLNYLKGFTEPIFIMTPLNILGEVATPVSMAFRHYGNIMSGSVIAVLIAAALQGLSTMVLGWLPGALGDIPFLQIGIPGVLSLYFDVFSGCMQAYIFAMLTMLNISGAFPQEAFEKRMKKKLAKKEKVLQINN